MYTSWWYLVQFLSKSHEFFGGCTVGFGQDSGVNIVEGDADCRSSYLWMWMNVIRPWRLIWHTIMEVWKRIFLSKWVICGFPVILLGSTSYTLKLHTYFLVLKTPVDGIDCRWKSSGQKSGNLQKPKAVSTDMIMQWYRTCMTCMNN